MKRDSGETRDTLAKMVEKSLLRQKNGDESEMTSNQAWAADRPKLAQAATPIVQQGYSY